jgi:hypothetical protein
VEEPLHKAIDTVRGIIDSALEIATDPNLRDRHPLLARRTVDDAEDLLEDLEDITGF